MRIASARDLGPYVRERRRQRGQTQAAVAAAAGVSRRWLSDLEAGKATAELGLVIQTLHALGLGLDVRPIGIAPGAVDLDELLDGLGPADD